MRQTGSFQRSIWYVFTLRFVRVCVRKCFEESSVCLTYIEANESLLHFQTSNFITNHLIHIKKRSVTKNRLTTVPVNASDFFSRRTFPGTGSSLLSTAKSRCSQGWLVHSWARCFHGFQGCRIVEWMASTTEWRSQLSNFDNELPFLPAFSVAPRSGSVSDFDRRTTWSNGETRSLFSGIFETRTLFRRGVLRISRPNAIVRRPVESETRRVFRIPWIHSIDSQFFLLRENFHAFSRRTRVVGKHF